PAHRVRRPPQTTSPPPTRALSARVISTTAFHTAESCPAAYPPDRTSPAPAGASLPAPLRWESPGPSPTPAGPGRTALRSCPENPAASYGPRCCLPSLRKPAEIPPASPPARSPPADNRTGDPGCSRASLWEFPLLPPRYRCSSGRTAAHRSAPETGLASVAAGDRTTLSCAPRSGPGSGTSGLSPPRQSRCLTDLPSRSGQTLAGANGTRCPAPPVGSPPATPAPSPTALLPALFPTALPKTPAALTAATTRTPASSCQTPAGAATPFPSTSPAHHPVRRQESHDP